MNAFFCVWGRYILFLTLMAALAGCSVPLPPSQPFSCARLTETHWMDFDFGVDSPSGLQCTPTAVATFFVRQAHGDPLDGFRLWRRFSR